MRILLAEDDGTSRQVLAGQVRKLGHEPLEAEDGALAWDLYQSEKPDIVITDWLMPKVDGLELCRRIREDHRVEYPYLIILTSMDRKVGFLEGMNAGADDFVTKPADIVELNVRLRVAERILKLQTQVKTLESLLPICPECKKIRTRDDQWEQVESYISKRSDAQFSHGICPQCYETVVMPQLAALKKRQQQGTL
jgi:sigma-B regulation protein RsbU (phosphoserine phosphatase)